MEVSYTPSSLSSQVRVQSTNHAMSGTSCAPNTLIRLHPMEVLLPRRSTSDTMTSAVYSTNLSDTFFRCEANGWSSHYISQELREDHANGGPWHQSEVVRKRLTAILLCECADRADPLLYFAFFDGRTRMICAMWLTASTDRPLQLR
jgi:hypothetical protein